MILYASGKQKIPNITLATTLGGSMPTYAAGDLMKRIQIAMTTLSIPKEIKPNAKNIFFRVSNETAIGTMNDSKRMEKNNSAHGVHPAAGPYTNITKTTSNERVIIVHPIAL